MKQVLLIYLILLTSCNFTYKDELSSYFKDMSYSTLQETIRKEKLLFKDSLIPPSEGNMPKKEIIDGYMVKIIKHFKKNLKLQTEDSTISEYKIKIIHKENKIAFYELYKTKNIRENDNWVGQDSFISKKTNTKLFNDLLKKYKNTYGTKLNTNELFDVNYIYGKSCGFSGLNPKYRTEMNQIIETENKDKLLDWLKSPVVELQLYAIEAIYKMENVGFTFSPDVYDFVKLVEKKNGYANVCSGCFYGYEQISTTVLKIKKQNKQLIIK